MSEFVSLGDVVRFGITISNPNASGALVNADETPRFYAYRNNLDTITLQGNFVLRTDLVGTYRGSGIFNAGNGFSAGDYVEVHASGKLNGAVNRAIVKSFVINDVFDANLVQINGSSIAPTNVVNANVIQVSGVYVAPADEVNANVIKVSGVLVHYNDLVNPTIFFSNIKFIKDGLNNRDEYTAQWFRNASPLPSGQVTNPAISVYRTSDQTALFENKVLNYFSVKHGTLRAEESTVANLAYSGEPYLAITSGTIDGATRQWQNIIGLDYLS
jgi:hypothetical protein